MENPVMDNGVVAELKVHSQRNCVPIPQAQMDYLQNNVAVSAELDRGVYMVKLRYNTVQYPAATEREASAMLWIHGGALINQATGVEVESTWASLQGFDDVVVLEVKRSTTMRAFFCDTQVAREGNPLTLSIARVPVATEPSMTEA